MACVFCKEPEFHRWIEEQAEIAGIPSDTPADEAFAKAFILSLCGVDSRNLIDTVPAAAQRFHELVRKPYLAWREGGSA